MKGITELKPEYKNCSLGYRVRLRYCKGTPQIQQTFLDSKYGSHEKAAILGSAYCPYPEEN